MRDVAGTEDDTITIQYEIGKSDLRAAQRVLRHRPDLRRVRRLHSSAMWVALIGLSASTSRGGGWAPFGFAFTQTYWR